MKRDRSGSRWPLGILGLFLALFIATQGVALALHTSGLFEMDGDAQDLTGAGLPDDWVNVYNGTDSALASVFIHDGPDPDTPEDVTHFTQGTSDALDIPDWAYHTNDTTPDKDQLLNAFAAAYKHEGDLVLFFGADRYTTEGNANVGFWFFRNPVGLNAPSSFSGSHTVGDLLIVSEFTQGGNVPTIQVYEWIGIGVSGGPLRLVASGADCSTMQATDVVCATVNHSPASAPWPYAAKNQAEGTFPTGALFEGAVNVTELMSSIGETPGCYSSFLAESRASDEPNAALKDFALGQLNTCEPLEVSKTAVTAFTRTHTWDIDKSVTPDEWDLFSGDSGTSEYTISLDKTTTDSNFAVSGVITVQNPNAGGTATITGVTDAIGAIAANVSCPVSFPYSLAGNGTLQCTYTATLPDATDRTNTATVATTGPIGGGTGQAPVSFANTVPTVVGYDSVNVTDDNGTPADDSDDLTFGPFSADGSETYDRTFTCDADEGTHTNTATIDETGASDSASVAVSCYELEVTKDAATALTRTFAWTIDKSVTPASWNLFRGDSGTSRYTVAVTKDAGTDSGFAVSGNIEVYNPAPMAAELTGVADVISPAIAATVDCGVTFPYDLAADDTLECTYSGDLPDATARTNTATASLQNYDYDAEGAGTAGGTTGFTGTANVSFAAPTVTEVNDTIDVDDTNGDSWQFSDDGSVSYDRTFTCDADKGTHNNTATIEQTGQSDSAAVTVACHALTVTKDALPSLTRTYDWDIQKTGDQSALTLSVGQQFLVNYSVVVSASYADSDFAVAGEITVANPAPIAARLNSVADVLPGASNLTVDCGVSFPYTLAANGSLTCDYAGDLPDASTRTNTGSATLQNYGYDHLLAATAAGTTAFSGTASVNFADAAKAEVDECIDVTDDRFGSLGTVCYGEAPKTFTYSMNVGPYAACGTYQFINVASFVSNDTAATGSDNHVVDVNVPCQGCTLTQGYWKTHSAKGPAPYDDTWAQIEEDTLFFLSEQSYHQVLWTPPQGNAYYNLAHQYIAAELNLLNGAGSTPEVDAAIAWAEAFFATALPGDKLSKEARNEVLARATLLDNYNNGLIGPGHCSEQ